MCIYIYIYIFSREGLHPAFERTNRDSGKRRFALRKSVSAWESKCKRRFALRKGVSAYFEITSKRSWEVVRIT